MVRAEERERGAARRARARTVFADVSAIWCVILNRCSRKGRACCISQVPVPSCALHAIRAAKASAAASEARTVAAPQVASPRSACGMHPSPRHRREARRAVGSAAPSLVALRYDTPGADRCNAPLAPPHFASAPLLPWHSGAVWRVVAVAGSSKADEECRWCFSAADAAPEGELIEPCSCAGSQVRTAKHRAQLKR